MIHNLAASELIIAKLVQLGSNRFVISPGSRSTPLTVAAARNQQAKTSIHFDERGAAYFALGQAKASKKPVVLICTSGTAVANYFPAVVEASMDNIPLIILSADRPPELIDVGANQSIFQENIYGRYPRLFKNLPPPEENSTPEQLVKIVQEIHEAASGVQPGPAHLNCQFREPLLPESESTVGQIDPQKLPTVLTLSKEGVSKISINQTSLVVQKILSSVKGVLVVGRAVQYEEAQSIVEFARHLNWPVFADIQSKLRLQIDPNIINHFDLALLNDTFSDQKPEMVIHFGSAFTSKRLLNYLNDPKIYYISVKQTPERIDQNHQVKIALQTKIEAFITSIERALTQSNIESNHEFADSATALNSKDRITWLQDWQRTESGLSSFLDSHLSEQNELMEAVISYELSKRIPIEHTLMVANSMPIREMEMFGQARGQGRTIIANRGASGIDGLIATAAGYADGSEKPLTLLLGDLSALHDLNSLSLIKNISQSLVIILINNDGGGIFNFLPVEAEKDVFENYFGTPHGRTFEHAAEMFQLDYALPKNLSEFRFDYDQACQKGNATIIEVRTDRYENHKFHKKIFQAIRES
ncbi:MAG: 2-succinyl-5-enolpyruvyl-6-hydroxy-3-cyclohexene-1-carboxylic-acid synthase [Candidatus Marinimicrobia bacterium]|nr:2-succinyl-5-enolpyruvyl-6-hydroxy-3-cyclohexene-1-carboxylic-acid synthase [Candidatus Neomarinimicrobiota bacterium]